MKTASPLQTVANNTGLVGAWWRGTFLTKAVQSDLFSPMAVDAVLRKKHSQTWMVCISNTVIKMDNHFLFQPVTPKCSIVAVIQNVTIHPTVNT